jgi:ribosomal protein L35
MIKCKTKSCAKKRFFITGLNKYRMFKEGNRHNLIKKTKHVNNKSIILKRINQKKIKKLLSPKKKSI